MNHAIHCHRLAFVLVGALVVVVAAAALAGAGLVEAHQQALAVYKKTKDPARAVKILEEAGVKGILDKKPTGMTDAAYVMLLNDYGFFLSETSDRYEEAIPILEKVIALDPKRHVAHLNLGDTYRKIIAETKDFQRVPKLRPLVVQHYREYARLLKEKGVKTPLPEHVESDLRIAALAEAGPDAGKLIADARIEATSPSSAPKKYPPYPEIWGVELPRLANKDPMVQPSLYKMPNGEIFVAYVTAEKRSKRVDGTCCDLQLEHAGQAFFSGEKRDLTGKGFETFTAANRKNHLEAEVIVFKDGSQLRQKIEGGGAKCWSPFSGTLLKTDPAGQVIKSLVLLYLPDHPQTRDLNPSCDGSGEQESVIETVENPIVNFALLEDETFLAFSWRHNLVLRLDKELTTRYPLNDKVFLVDRQVVSQVLRGFIPERIEAMYHYLFGLKQRVSQ